MPTVLSSLHHFKMLPIKRRNSSNTLIIPRAWQAWVHVLGCSDNQMKKHLNPNRFGFEALELWTNWKLGQHRLDFFLYCLWSNCIKLKEHQLSISTDTCIKLKSWSDTTLYTVFPDTYWMIASFSNQAFICVTCSSTCLHFASNQHHLVIHLNIK